MILISLLYCRVTSPHESANLIALHGQYCAVQYQRISPSPLDLLCMRWYENEVPIVPANSFPSDPLWRLSVVANWRGPAGPGIDFDKATGKWRLTGRGGEVNAKLEVAAHGHASIRKHQEARNMTQVQNRRSKASFMVAPEPETRV